MGYPKELKAMVLQRMMAPGNETIGMLAKEFNVTEATLYAWRREALKAGAVVGGTGAVPEQWSGAVKFAVVLETASLPQAELAEYCRRKGLYIEQVQAWRSQCEGVICQGRCHGLQTAVSVSFGLSGAGLSQTTPGLDQSLVGPRQRSGRAALAC